MEVNSTTSLKIGILVYCALVIIGTCVGACLTLVKADARTFIASVIAVPLPVLIMAGYATVVVSHFLPNSRRNFKYNLFFSVCGFQKGCILFLMPSLVLGELRNLDIITLLAFMAATDISVILLAVLIFYLWLCPYFMGRAVRERLSMRLRRFFFCFRKFQVPLAFLAVLVPLPFTGCVYLILRYYIVEKFKLRPILYFRSFGAEETPSIFSKVVLKEASRFGVVTCLAHESQRPYQMQGDVHPLGYGRMFVVKDEFWRPWVERELRSAEAVIIDVSRATTSLKWELDCTRDLLKPAQIFLLRHKDEDLEALPAEGSFRFDVPASRKFQELARDAIRGWLLELFFSSETTRLENPRLGLTPQLRSPEPPAAPV